MGDKESWARVQGPGFQSPFCTHFTDGKVKPERGGDLAALTVKDIREPGLKGFAGEGLTLLLGKKRSTGWGLLVVGGLREGLNLLAEPKISGRKMFGFSSTKK